MNLNSDNHKDSNKDILTENYELLSAAAGDSTNEDILNCRKCKENGFPHEPITVEEVKGRVLSDGSNEIVGYKIKNYFDDKPHQHKHQRCFKGWDLEAMLS